MAVMRQIKPMLRRLLDRYGVQIKRTQIPFFYLRKAPANPGKGRVTYVEMIGPSGVGKTTLIKASKGTCFRGYISKEDIKQLTVAQDLIESRSAAYQRLLEIKSASLWKLTADSLQKARSMRFRAEVIIKDISIFCSSAGGRFLLDEGLCTIFGTELLLLSDEHFAELMYGRALIYLAPRHASTAVTRIRHREALGGHVAGHYRGLADQALENAVATDMRILEDLMRRFATHGIHSMRLFAEDGIEHNVERLRDFETALRLPGQG